mgnify:FL=1
MTFETIEEIKATIQQLVIDTNASNIDVDFLANQIFVSKINNISSKDFHDLLIAQCVMKASLDYEYDRFAICIMNYQDNIHTAQNNIFTFHEKVNFINEHIPNYLSEDYVSYVNCHKDVINYIIDSYKVLPRFLTYFGYLTLNNAYLMKVDGHCIETPMDMFMRCSIVANYKTDKSHVYQLKRIQDNFMMNYQGLFTHATPTMYNAGTKHEQLASCFLLGTEDSIDGIYKTITDCAKISQKSGGIGFHCSNIRAAGAKIHSSNGESSGIIPMLKVFSDTAAYVNQGGRGSKRPGAFVAFLEPWHADIREFLETVLLNGEEKWRVRDLNIGLWIPDLFMKQLEINGDWYLMCPSKCPGLNDVYGEEFETLYWSYVEQNLYNEKIKATEIFRFILAALSDKGEPYLMFKDTINRKSNQDNIGVIKSSNLCCEITEVSDSNYYAVCNLASIAVNRFLIGGKIDHDKLLRVTEHVTENLNNCMDINEYPVPEAALTNSENRPIGIGIQGMGDVLLALKIPYDSSAALDIEAEIMETIYFGALTKSNQLAKESSPYQNFAGSNFSKQILQFDMGYTNLRPMRHDWQRLKLEIRDWGTINSLLTALMPTASTAQILGNMEGFEPLTSNIYSRKTSSGSFTIVNKYLVKDLKELNLWNEEMLQLIIREKGSIQNIQNIPEDIRRLYKTVWEIKQKWIMDHAIARAPFIDQSQSMNLHHEQIDPAKIQKGLFYAWRNGLKTGSYYTRSKPSSNSEQQTSANNTKRIVTYNDDVCTSCSA